MGPKRSLFRGPESCKTNCFPCVSAQNGPPKGALTTGSYKPDHVLMMGDAPGDFKAAKANNALFYPINPGQEEDSWKRFHDEALDKFFAGTYAGQYEADLIAAFDACLPETPPGKNSFLRTTAERRGRPIVRVGLFLQNDVFIPTQQPPSRAAAVPPHDAEDDATNTALAPVKFCRRIFSQTVISLSPQPLEDVSFHCSEQLQQFAPTGQISQRCFFPVQPEPPLAGKLIRRALLGITLRSPKDVIADSGGR